MDANFKLNFNFSKIGDTGIYVGTNPIVEEEIEELSKEGITAIINL